MHSTIATVQRSVHFAGIPIVDGVGAGRAWIVAWDSREADAVEEVSGKDIVKEIAKLRQAIQLTALAVESSLQYVLDNMGEEYAEIFVALREFLHDPVILRRCIAIIEERHLPAGIAVSLVLGECRRDLEQVPSLYLRQRAFDLVEIEQGLLQALTNPVSYRHHSVAYNPSDQSGRIAIVQTLTPSLVLQLGRSRVRGIVAGQCGTISHAAILCRAFGLPTVAGIDGITSPAYDGANVEIDGCTGGVTVSRDDGDAVPAAIAKLAARRRKPLEGIDRVHVVANISLAENAIEALAAGAEGIGLYRTEFEFIAAGRLLSEEEQMARYRSVVLAVMGMTVNFRLLDISKDKFVPALVSQESPVISQLFGAEFLLANPEIVQTQARAIARASTYGPVRVTYPMISSPEQFVDLKAIFCSAMEGIDTLGTIQHGAMLENPAACMAAGDIFAVADFGCLGTNDLSQQLLGGDRETGVSVSRKKGAGAHLLWEMIGHVARQAQSRHRPLSVCGEIASNPRTIRKLLRMGIDTISIDPSAIRRLTGKT